MTTNSVRVHIDDRGASRQIVDMWIPHLDVDVVWLVGAPPPDDQSAPLGVPVVELAATDVVALASEVHDEELRALVIFASPVDLRTSAALGLQPCRVTMNHLQPPGETQRLAHEIEVDVPALEALEALEARGFTFEIQPLPNVTARPWVPSSAGSGAPVDAETAEG